MSSTVRIAIPLALAFVLGTVFVLLLRSEMEQVPPPTVPPPTVVGAPERREAPEPAQSLLAAPDIPVGPVEAPATPVSRQRFFGREDGLHRWNLAELPSGWDPALAKSLHDWFESMDEYEAAARAGESSEALEQAREELRDHLASLGPQALPTLGAILGQEPDFVYRRFLLYGIGDLGTQSEGATWYLRDYFMKRQADPENRSEVGHVVKAMERLRNDTSFEMLQDLMRNDQARPYREKLVEALGEHPRRDEAIGVFVDGMQESTSTKQRLRHAQALGKVADPNTLPDLYHAFQRESYWVTKQTILGSIGKIGDASAIPFLEEQARYAAEGAVRLSAGKALQRVGTPHAMQVLRHLAPTENDARVRESFQRWSAGEE